jgi:hypothetical protein
MTLAPPELAFANGSSNQSEKFVHLRLPASTDYPALKPRRHRLGRDLTLGR